MFEFRTVPEVVVGESASLQLPALIEARFSGKRIALVTDAPLRALGLLEPLLTALGAAQFTVDIFDGVVADPPEATVRSAIDRARDTGAEIVIGIGGGSSMDVAKLVAAFAGSTQDLAQAYGIDKVTGPRLPLIQVP